MFAKYSYRVLPQNNPIIPPKDIITKNSINTSIISFNTILIMSGKFSNLSFIYCLQ